MAQTEPPIYREKLTAEIFDASMRPPGQALIHLNGLAGSRALERWDFSFLREKFGSFRIFLDPPMNIRGQGPIRCETTLGCLVDYVQAKESPLSDLGRDCGMSRPFFGIANKLFLDHPQLSADLPMPAYLDNWLTHFNPEFQARHKLSPLNSLVLLPKDAQFKQTFPLITCLAQIRGRSQFRLHAPAATPQCNDFVLDAGSILYVPPNWILETQNDEPALLHGNLLLNHTNFGTFLRARLGDGVNQLLANLP